ncbi:hypothetical protein AB0O01_35110 [Streptomyces sp. NPDC093252]|uniref:hypothetical protein n=1 Tax=Streptomyces sp. NPDC093252 TaxID=3154980 RepID=UPI0034311DA8
MTSDQENLLVTLRSTPKAREETLGIRRCLIEPDGTGTAVTVTLTTDDDAGYAYTFEAGSLTPSPVTGLCGYENLFHAARASGSQRSRHIHLTSWEYLADRTRDDRRTLLTRASELLGTDAITILGRSGIGAVLARADQILAWLPYGVRAHLIVNAVPTYGTLTWRPTTATVSATARVRAAYGDRLRAFLDGAAPAAPYPAEPDPGRLAAVYAHLGRQTAPLDARTCPDDLLAALDTLEPPARPTLEPLALAPLGIPGDPPPGSTPAAPATPDSDAPAKPSTAQAWGPAPEDHDPPDGARSHPEDDGTDGGDGDEDEGTPERGTPEEATNDPAETPEEATEELEDSEEIPEEIPDEHPDGIPDEIPGDDPVADPDEETDEEAEPPARYDVSTVAALLIELTTSASTAPASTAPASTAPGTTPHGTTPEGTDPQDPDPQDTHPPPRPEEPHPREDPLRHLVHLVHHAPPRPPDPQGVTAYTGPALPCRSRGDLARLAALAELVERLVGDGPITPVLQDALTALLPEDLDRRIADAERRLEAELRAVGRAGPRAVGRHTTREDHPA